MRHALLALIVTTVVTGFQTPTGATDDQLLYPAPSLNPQVMITNGTPEQHDRLWDAVDRFVDAGLSLPDLDVVFTTDRDQCKGSIGLFSRRSIPWKIFVCNQHITSVYLHELAHAWTRSHLTDEVREEFMKLRDLETWNDKSFAWEDRAVEAAAVALETGLSDPGFFEGWVEERLIGFELLTGIEPPRFGG